MYRFHTIINDLCLAYSSKDFIAVKILLHEYLNLAAQAKEDENYSLAIHQAYTLSGLVALEDGKIGKAKECIINSSLLPKSELLLTEGPNMLLAHKLLILKEIEIVLYYLQICRKIWHSENGVKKISRWETMINKGFIPDFGHNLVSHLKL